MPLLNTQNIKSDFITITGLSENDFKYLSVIENAKRYVEARIIPEALTPAEISGCEYAACAHAVYEYALQQIISDSIIISQVGKAVADYRENSVIQAAYAFRKSVFDSMKDIIRDDNFVFQAVEG